MVRAKHLDSYLVLGEDVLLVAQMRDWVRVSVFTALHHTLQASTWDACLSGKREGKQTVLSVTLQLWGLMTSNGDATVPYLGYTQAAYKPADNATEEAACFRRAPAVLHFI